LSKDASCDQGNAENQERHNEVVKWTGWLVVLTLTASAVSQGCGTSSDTESAQGSQSADVRELIKGVEFKPGRDGMDPRPAFAERLGNLGPAAKEAVPALKKLTRDKNPEVRTAAQQALAKIEGQ
jgi:hypothetical protein